MALLIFGINLASMQEMNIFDVDVKYLTLNGLLRLFYALYAGKY